MPLICHFLSSSNSFLSNAADAAQIIIAIANLFLAYNIFVYQRKTNIKKEESTAKLNEQNIKLQWFKELIIQPNFNNLIAFYDNLELIKGRITSDNLTEDEILGLNQYVKDEAKKFRLNFTDVLLNIDKELYEKIKANTEDLVTKLTLAFSNDEHKFKNPKTFETIILMPIKYSKHNLIALIFNYKGV